MHWHTHPKLKGRFLPDYPDDLQVLVHDGGPRTTDKKPEAVWVTVTGALDDVFTGRVLNEPTQLRTIRQGQTIRFIMPEASKFPILVTEKYLAERSVWRIRACEKCGFSELFDAPSDLISKLFPNTPEGSIMDMFTSKCPLCGGVQVIQSTQDVGRPVQPSPKKSWWQIWK